MTKKKVNWTIDPYVINILKQAQKLSNRQVSYSYLIEYAIKKTYTNKKDQIKNEIRKYQKIISQLGDELNALEELEEK